MARMLSDDIPRRRSPVLTYALMATWAVVWILQSLRADDGQEGSGQALACRWGMVPIRVIQGTGAGGTDPCVALADGNAAWLEVLTAQFMHASWWHLAANLILAWVFAPAVEERLGRARFLPFAVGCGYVAFLAEALLASSSTSPVLGGSGVVAAVLGAYVVLFPHARLHLTSRAPDTVARTGGMPAIIPIVLWITYETLSAVAGAAPDSAHWVHVTGFALGALLARAAAGARPGTADAPAPTTPRPEWARAAIARNQPEAEMIQAILRDAGIPAFVRRMAGFDVPEYLAGGPRDVMVPADRVADAHAVITPLEPDDEHTGSGVAD
jgi:membrane associated rhomboid family serine protease